MSNVNVAVQRTTLPTSTGTHDVTISGFGTPKAAIFIYYRDTGTAGTANKQNVEQGYGFTDGTNDFAAYTDWLDGQANGWHQGKRSQSASHCVILDRTNANNCTFNSWITDGVRLNVTNGSSLSGCHVDVVLFGGSDLSAAAGYYETPGGVGNTRTISGLSFQPNLVFGTCAGINNANNMDWSVLSFGCAHDNGTTIDHAVIARGAKNNTDNLGWVQDNDGFIAQAFTQGGANWVHKITSITSDGFVVTESDASSYSSVNYGGSGGNDDAGYLALDIGSLNAKLTPSYGTPNSTGLDTITTTFTPQALIGMTTRHTSPSNLSSTDTFYAESWGNVIIDANQSFYNQNIVDRNTSTSVTGTYRSSGTALSLYVWADTTTNTALDVTVYAEADFDSFSSTGTVLDYSTADASNSAYGWVLQIEEGAAGPQEVAGEAFGTAGSSGAPTAILMISSEAFGSAASSGDPEAITSVASSVMGAASSSGNPTAGAKVCASCQCIPTVRSSSTQSAVTVVAAGAYGTAGSSGAGAPVTSIESSVIGAAGSLGTPGFGGSRWIIPSKVFGSATSSGAGTAGLAALVSGSVMGMAGSTGNPSYQGGTVNLNLDLTLPSILSKAQVVVPSNFANILNTLGSVRQYAKSAKGISAQHPRTYKVPKGSRVYRVENYPLD